MSDKAPALHRATSDYYSLVRRAKEVAEQLAQRRIELSESIAQEQRELLDVDAAIESLRGLGVLPKEPS
jgi:uncharacterized protein YlxW (UPF0749 family)